VISKVSLNHPDDLIRERIGRITRDKWRDKPFGESLSILGIVTPLPPFWLAI
jgi:hypothetical protein